jgi:hypothetical protein
LKTQVVSHHGFSSRPQRGRTAFYADPWGAFFRTFFGISGKFRLGKTIAVALPEGAAYAVCGGDDACVSFTTVSKNPGTALPANGKIAFIGKAGDAFRFEFR